jgi:hypothetical protein
MRSLKISVFIFFIIQSVISYAQLYPTGFGYPIDREPVITGNYGEIRPNHFHAGLDFSTDAILNLPIKSVADGYVSRIKISSVGYGRVLYVTHANGYVSVYAHQKKYADKIDTYTKQQQRKQQKNEIELFPKPNELPIKKGEIIGYTGNSGSSTGPHLHFEIREEKSEIPINPLLVYDVKDNVKPMIMSIGIYNIADTSNVRLETLEPVKNSKEKLMLTKNTIVLDGNAFAIGFSGYDVANGSSNKNTIYEAKVKLDNQVIYHHQLNNISFDNGRYVNVFSEKTNGQKMQKCFVPICYDIAIYKNIVNGGKMLLLDTLKHTVELIVNDEKGNINSILFYVKAKQLSGYKSNSNKYNAFCNKDFKLKEDNFDISIQRGSIVNDMYIHKRTYIKAPIEGGVELGNKDDKVIRAFKIGLKINNPIKQKESKLVMTINGDVIGGQFEDGWLRAESKAFGTFNYNYDTIAPTINILHSNKKKITIIHFISFKISDKLSGIADYNVYVNDVWQIAEYDVKTQTVTCFLTEPPKTYNSIRIEVIDKVGNKAIVSL